MQSLRQSELFASKDWLVLYQAFTTVNFNASDPTSINRALREYISVNYPEDFNDWIESSEFVAIIDLLSWLAGTLAFKIDINARENFLETAEARESVLRLARFLSYNPRRNRPATGLVKLVEISTDDQIVDSTGVNLAGVKVQWNNPDDPDWFERFTAIMSNAFVPTNQFGTPLKAGTVSGTRTNLYRINCLQGNNNFGFNAPINGEVTDFDLCNGDFDDNGPFFERTPDKNGALNIYYRNDGNGNSSSRTGFFMLFKQGTLVEQNFRIDFPVENQLLNLDVAGVNEEDVWVQTVTENGRVLVNWEKVPAIFSSNITFNNIPSDQRDIFSVITRENDRVTIRFADGIFGNAPIGNIRVWHRVSNGRQYLIKPADITRVTKNIQYFNKAGEQRNLRMVFSLQETVSNATTRETEEQVRTRAPSVYAAQNRMVSGEDYNTFPLSSNIANKIKAVNRIYSGHSRFVDLNDPTSTYTDVVVHADDGILFSETANIYQEVPITLGRSPIELLNLHLQPFLRSLNIKSYIESEVSSRIDANAPIPNVNVPLNTTWHQVTTARFSSSGWVSRDNPYFRAGGSIKFLLPNNTEKWVGIVQLNGLPRNQAPDDGIRGPITLSEDIPSGSRIIAVLPNFSAELPFEVAEQIVSRFDDNTSDLRGFSLWFNPENSLWVVRDEITSLLEPENYSDIIHIATVEYYAGSMWRFSARGSRIVFESARKVKWYYGGERGLDSETGQKRSDTLTILKSNTNLLDPTGAGIKTDRVFAIRKLYFNNDGSQEPRRIQLDYEDIDSDGSRDDPESYAILANLPTQQSTLFWQMGMSFGQTSYKPIFNVNVFTHPAEGVEDIPNRIVTKDSEQFIPIVFKNGDLVYMAALNAFFRRMNDGWMELPRREFKIARGRGGNTALRWMVPDDLQTGEEKLVVVYSKRVAEVAAQGLDPDVYLIRDGSLMFKWKHYAPADHRIDPSITNVIDLFMLTNEYDFATRLWIANGAKMADVPVPPTELDLRILMSDYENYKMFSDAVVWRPVSYKFLFGNGSEDYNLRARFKVVKLANADVADGEIKSRVISAINEFFDIDRWDFGETFYFTELAAYVHQRLAGVIGSIVIVPMDEEASFGDGFEVKSRSDEIFISTAQVSDVEIIQSNTSANLRIR